MDIDKEIKMLTDYMTYMTIKGMEDNMKIKKVIFNDPATVVLWADGTKTIVKAGEGDIYDPEKGLAMAIAKKALGNKGNYYEVFKKWLPEETTNTDRGKSIEPIVKNVKAANIGEDGLLLEGELTKTGEKFFEKLLPEKHTESKIKASAIVQDHRGIFSSCIEFECANDICKEKANDIANMIVDKLYHKNPAIIDDNETVENKPTSDEKIEKDLPDNKYSEAIDAIEVFSNGTTGIILTTRSRVDMLTPIQMARLLHTSDTEIRRRCRKEWSSYVEKVNGKWQIPCVVRD